MNIYNATPLLSVEDLSAVAFLLNRGQLVVIPTETVYGLAASLSHPDAIERIFLVKQRPRHKPIILHISDLSQITSIVTLSPLFKNLAASFWPGPLTIVTRHLPHFSSPATAGSGTVAIRMTSHPCALQIIGALGIPVAATSANRSGGVSPTHAQVEQLEGISALVDAGRTPHGMESTVISIIDDQISLIRKGVIPLEKVREKAYNYPYEGGRAHGDPHGRKAAQSYGSLA
jgi:L-threonylcarbamoyladenylate synthase